MSLFKLDRVHLFPWGLYSRAMYIFSAKLHLTFRQMFHSIKVKSASTCRTTRAIVENERLIPLIRQIIRCACTTIKAVVNRGYKKRRRNFFPILTICNGLGLICTKWTCSSRSAQQTESPEIRILIPLLWHVVCACSAALNTTVSTNVFCSFHVRRCCVFGAISLWYSCIYY